MAVNLDLWIKAASFAISIGAAIYAWFATRRADVDEHFERADTQIRDTEIRLRDLEHRVEAMPGREDLHDIQLQLERQTSAINELKAVVRGGQQIMSRQENVVMRLEEHLLGGGR